jgi:hypothetical protein
LILVLAFGNPAFHDWAYKQNGSSAGGFFLQTLTWPTWHFNKTSSLQDLFADDLKAVLLIIGTYALVSVLVGAQASGHGFSQFLSGWAGYIFAACLAGLLAAWVLHNASLLGALQWAVGGAAYGLIVGWIVGLAIVILRK